MQKFKGTPGPWFIKPVPNCKIEGAVNVIQTHSDNGLGFHIAYASGWIDRKETKTEADANARILAAAPELLEALQEIVAMNVQYCLDKYGDSSKAEAMACVTTARAAIAKALGQ